MTETTKTAQGATAPSAAPAMKWEKVGNREWKAVGKHGTFTIEQSGRIFWARYSSNVKAFKMPPRSKLSQAKAMCEDNGYWEA
ncbi:MAG: hypothetical protein ACI4JY_07175 [Oscillospiraceae bacterium]